VKVLKNQTFLQNSLTFNVALSEGLAMPCANCTMMGPTINSVLIPNHFTTYKVMNEFVAFESKKQPTSSSFILQFNFNKLEASLPCAFNPATKLPWIINLPWARLSFTSRWLGVILHQMSIVITIETFDLGQVSFHLLDQRLFVRQIFLIVVKPNLPWPHFHLL
jgi:hypothetical protein